MGSTRKIFIFALAVFMATPIAQAPARPVFPGLNGEYYTYVLNDPIPLNTKLSPFERGVHYAYHVASTVGKFYFVGRHLGLSGDVGVTLETLERLGMDMPFLSWRHLVFDEHQEIWKKLQDIKELPGVDQVQVISGGPIVLKGGLAVQRKALGIVLLQSTQPIEKLPEGWGGLTPIKDLDDVWMDVHLVVGGTVSTRDWRVRISDLLAGRGLPAELASAWKKEVKAHENKLRLELEGKVSKTVGKILPEKLKFLPRKLIRLPEEAVSMQASLQTEGKSWNIGEIENRSGVREMLRMPVADKLTSSLKWTLTQAGKSVQWMVSRTDQPDWKSPIEPGNLDVHSKTFPLDDVESCIFQGMQFASKKTEPLKKLFRKKREERAAE